MTPEQKAEHNRLEWVVGIIILVVISGITFLVGGSDALFDWLRH